MIKYVRRLRCALFYVGARLYYMHPTPRPEEIDLVTGWSEVEQSTYVLVFSPNRRQLSHL